MLIRITCSIAFFIFVRFIATSQNPEVAEFRHLLAMTVGMSAGEMKSMEDTRSSMERLKARNSTVAAPCIVAEQCKGQGGMQGLANSLATDFDRIDAAFGTLEYDVKPLFIKVEPKR